MFSRFSTQVRFKMLIYAYTITGPPKLDFQGEKKTPSIMKHDKIMRPGINIVEQINRRAVCRPGTAGADTSSSAEKNHEDSNDPLK